MKTNLRLLALLLLLGFAQTTAHAQCPGVWVPDANFRALLKQSFPSVFSPSDSLLPCTTAFMTWSFSCSNSNIANISGIEYFTNLHGLNCSGNQLTTLPALPNSLKDLSCSNNQLVNLPILPDSLENLFCDGNDLVVLPVLPSTLKELRCGRNLLSNLVSLPASLIKLNCYSNQLTSLPILPSSLSTLDCSWNQIINLPSLPNSLTSIDCNNNLLIDLPSLPNNLASLGCASNQLTRLPFLPNTLNYLLCGTNQLTSLPALPYRLWNLNCSDNQLSNLPALNDSLTALDCRNNQIVCLPYLPDSIHYLYTQNNPLFCFPNAPSNVYSTDRWLNICTTPCITTQNFITGQVFVDQNSNGQPDAAEPRIERHILAANGENTASDRFGIYAFYLDSGSYTLIIAHIKWHTLSTPTTPYTFNFPANDSIVRNVNFGFVPTPNITDVAVSLTAVDRPRPGFSFCYNLSYKNEGTMAASGTVSLNIDPQLNYTGQTAFSFSGLPVWSSWDTTVCLTVPVSLALGTPLASTATITPTLPDADTTNNRATETSVVVGSYDPNDKACSPESLTPAEVTAGKRLTYTIRFQNTGTAEAYFVAIEDTLDAAHLDISSLEVIAASHSYEMSLSGPGHVKFMFHGINLPDSTTDEPNSHGFIKYSIRPKSTLALGDQISNTAHIYFDFNPAVITNTVLTPVALPASILDGQLGTLSLQPNPAATSVTLRADALAGQAVSLTVLDLTGRAVYQASEAVFTGQTALDLSDLPAGCYIVQLQAQGGQLSQKLIVVR